MPAPVPTGGYDPVTGQPDVWLPDVDAGKPPQVMNLPQSGGQQDTGPPSDGGDPGITYTWPDQQPPQPAPAPAQPRQQDTQAQPQPQPQPSFQPYQPDISQYAFQSSLGGDPGLVGTLPPNPATSGFFRALGGDIYDMGRGMYEATAGNLGRMMTGEIQPGTPEAESAARQAAVAATGLGGAGSLMVGAGEAGPGVALGMARARRPIAYPNARYSPGETPPQELSGPQQLAQMRADEARRGIGGNQPPEPMEPGGAISPGPPDVPVTPAPQIHSNLTPQQAMDFWIDTGRLPEGWHVRYRGSQNITPNTSLYEAYHAPNEPLPEPGSIRAERMDERLRYMREWRRTDPQQRRLNLTARDRSDPRPPSTPGEVLPPRSPNTSPGGDAYAGRPTNYPALSPQMLNAFRNGWETRYRMPMPLDIEQALAETQRTARHGSVLDEAMALHRMGQLSERYTGVPPIDLDSVVREVTGRRAYQEEQARNSLQNRGAAQTGRQQDISRMREQGRTAGGRQIADQPHQRPQNLHRIDDRSSSREREYYMKDSENGRTTGRLSVRQESGRQAERIIEQARRFGSGSLFPDYNGEPIVYVNWVGAMGSGGDVWSMGVKNMRRMLVQLKREFPDTYGVFGYRISGAREATEEMGGPPTTGIGGIKWEGGPGGLFFIPFSDADNPKMSDEEFHQKYLAGQGGQGEREEGPVSVEGSAGSRQQYRAKNLPEMRGTYTQSWGF
jgi:hypothetical protein